MLFSTFNKCITTAAIIVNNSKTLWVCGGPFHISIKRAAAHESWVRWGSRVCMYVCIYRCVYVCMYGCMCVCVCVGSHITRRISYDHYYYNYYYNNVRKQTNNKLSSKVPPSISLTLSAIAIRNISYLDTITYRTNRSNIKRQSNN